MQALNAVEAVALSVLVLLLQAGILLHSVARPLGSALHAYDLAAHERAERAVAMPPFGESIEVRGVRSGHGI